jgi:GT2 family glycosyltransferase
MLTLGVPTLNRYDLCELMLGSACLNTRVPDRLAVVDNGSQLSEFDVPMFTIGGEPTRRLAAEVVRPGRNLGVGPAWNLLAKKYLEAPEDRLLICGDDLSLGADCIDQLLKTMTETDADFVFPDPARSKMHQMFSCFMVRSSLFEKVGYFDERFWPAYFEDNDFHRRMKFAGAIEAVAPCGYDHLNSGTMKRYSKEELEQHHVRFRAVRDYYIEKWGGLPGEEKFSIPFDAQPSLSF